MPVDFIIEGQPVSNNIRERSRSLRKRMTSAEKMFWLHVRNNQIEGLHFRRQQVIHGVIVDFYCHAASLIIEIDGEIHEFKKSEDQQRDQRLVELGFKVLRFRNDEVLGDIDKVIEGIKAFCR